ncbi:MAG: carbamoyltransferase family protein [Candidatus Woesearchaeota archaeon]
MYILGIGCYYHDASACMVKDGKLIAAAEEERFTRKKHDVNFPINAIKYCIKEAGISVDEIDYVAFYEKPFLKFERLMHQHLEMFPRSMFTFIKAMPSWINEKLRVPRELRKKLKYKGDILFVQHHMAHAASAYLVSPFKEAAVLTVDGVGEWTTTSYGYAKGNSIDLYKNIEFPHSIGLLYSTITAYLGFSVNNSEYKVMGLAPYGVMDKKKNPYYKKLLKVIDLKEDGSFALDMSYFVYHYKASMPSEKMCKLLGGPISKRDIEMTQRHKDIAAALQLVTEEALSRIINHLYDETKCENIVFAGGVALNSVYNGKILRNSKFKNIWIQPNASDGGACIGATFYAYNTILNRKRTYVMESAFLGPGYSDKEIKSYLDKNKVKYRTFKSDEELIKTTAKLIYENNVLGWFQGRMEWGPRALGSRSILSNACNKEMQEILNLKVKHREKFRPFAPVVCEDDANKYFECDNPIPLPTDFMLMVYPIKKQYHKVIPAVTHVDGSGRLQTIRRNQNRRYYDVIKEFGKMSGIPILINTSFNIRGEPIVCTPKDAYRCMMGTGIDFLVMGKFLIKRMDNPKDLWDSEKYAKD